MIIFRVDSSDEIGAGHVMRCLALAQALSSIHQDVQFICQALAGNSIPIIENAGYPVHQLPIIDPAQEAKEIINFITTQLTGKVTWLIVDHYGLDECWEALLRPYVEKIMVIDDLANRRHQCDMLLDQTVNRNTQDYVSLVPAACRFMVGSEYALLRAEFSRLRQQAFQRRQQTSAIKRVLIHFGASDSKQVTQLFLQELIKRPLNLQVDVVVGSPPKQNEKNNYPDYIHIHHRVENISQLMLDADIAIGAAGTSSWERCCLGLPSLLVVIADNQEKVATELDKKGAAKLIGKIDSFTMTEAMALLAQGIRQPEIFTTMSESAMQLCDGQGVGRVVAELQK